MIKGGASTASMASRPHQMQITASVFGKAVKLLYGLCQAAPDLIWYNDWQASSHPSNAALNALFAQGGGKKSGKASKKSNTKYYSAAVDLLFGHAPVAGVMSVWFNNLKLIVRILSATGTIAGDGSFTFPVASGASKVNYLTTVPGTPYQVTVPNFVAPKNVADLTHSLYMNQVPLGISPPGPFQYTLDYATGQYTFNSAQAGDSIRITYFQTTSSSGGVLAGVLAATIHEDYSATFTDYGGPGTVDVFGNWERPLWNTTYPVPGRIDAGAYTARDPYSFTWDGVNPTITTPVGLAGKLCTVYYGTPLILKSDGTFRSNTTTPLQILNLEFERALGSGTEYTNHPSEQIVQSWVSGAGSNRFDLGVANTMPNVNFEIQGAFAQWPNGDADVADIITDICYSGPVLV